MTKNKLYNICSDKAVELVAAYDPKLSAILESVIKEKENVFSGLTQGYF